MYIWKKEYVRYNEYTSIHGVIYEVCDEVIFKRHECEWIVNQAVAKFIKYNPRHLPVIMPRPVLTNEPFYVVMAIERIERGYHVISIDISFV